VILHQYCVVIARTVCLACFPDSAAKTRQSVCNSCEKRKRKVLGKLRKVVACTLMGQKDSKVARVSSIGLGTNRL
jgi:hypothetical protein